MEQLEELFIDGEIALFSSGTTVEEAGDVDEAGGDKWGCWGGGGVTIIVIVSLSLLFTCL